MTLSKSLFSILSIVACGSAVLLVPSLSRSAEPPPPPRSSVEADASVNLGHDGPKARGDLRFSVDEDGLIQTESGTLSDAIHFESKSAELSQDAETRSVLIELSNFMKRYPEVRISIEGHTDSRGSTAANAKLSEQRAKSLKLWLEHAGVDSDRIEFKGLGENDPSIREPNECHNSNEDSAPASCREIWKKNRRVEFVVIGGRETIGAAYINSKGAECRQDVQDQDGFQRGVYIYLAPLGLGDPISDDSYPDARSLSYEAGFGIGYLFDPRGAFRVALGLDAEIMPTSHQLTGACQDDSTGANLCNGSMEFRINATARLGGGNPRVWGYGIFAPGLAIGRTNPTTAYGFSLGVGAGLQGIVGRKGFFLGGELGFDPMWFPSPPDEFLYSGVNANLDVKFMLGWYFGYENRSRH